MGIEEQLFRMFGNMNFSGSSSIPPVTGLFDQMVQNMNIGILRKMRAQMDRIIKEYEKKNSAKGGGKDFGFDSGAWETEGRTTKGGSNINDMDPFKILGVNFNSTYEEVKEAYKKRARQVHPDKGGSNEDMMKVNAAFETLKRFNGWV